jgi:hypothetical protein
MSRHQDPERAGLTTNAWPATFQAAWQQGIANAKSPFKKYGGGRRLSEHTLAKSEKGLRRYYGFLHRIGDLDDCISPGDRLDTGRLDKYFEHLVACGNADSTIDGRFRELQSAFTLMYPNKDFSWVTKPNGYPLRESLEMRMRSVFVPGNAELLGWAGGLFNEAIHVHDSRFRCSQVRDALMIAILATQAPRQRALASLQVGIHVRRVSDGWIIDQTGELTKMQKRLVLPVVPEVAVFLERYLAVERLELLKGIEQEALWISWYGTPLTVSGIVNMLWRRSGARFGHHFGTHRFRKSLTTTQALESPETPFDAPLILGHSPEVSIAHYNRAKAIASSRRHSERLARLRHDSEALAKAAVKAKDRFGF